MATFFVQDGTGDPGSKGPVGLPGKDGGNGDYGIPQEPLISGATPLTGLIDNDWLLDLLRQAEDDYAIENLIPARSTLEFVAYAAANAGAQHG